MDMAATLDNNDKALTFAEFEHVAGDGVSACVCDACHKYMANAGDVIVLDDPKQYNFLDRLWDDMDWPEYPHDAYPGERDEQDLQGVSLNGGALSDGFQGDFDDRDDWGFHDYEEYCSMMDTDTFVPSQASRLIEKCRIKHEAPVVTRFKKLRGKQQSAKLEAKHKEREQSVGIFNGHIPYTAENIARGKRLHQSTMRNLPPVNRIKRDTIRRARVEIVGYELNTESGERVTFGFGLVAIV